MTAHLISHSIGLNPTPGVGDSTRQNVDTVTPLLDFRLSTLSRRASLANSYSCDVSDNLKTVWVMGRVASRSISMLAQGGPRPAPDFSITSSPPGSP